MYFRSNHCASHPRLFWWFLTVLLTTGALASCAYPERSPEKKSLALPTVTQTVAPIRFLLSFDDGPSIQEDFNPTRHILEKLADNPIQPGIKAIFFVQTQATNGGGTPAGQALMQREYREGHLLGFHTATPGHSNHRRMSAELFEASLHRGISDHKALTGILPKLVRPPFWNYDARTFQSYHQHGMQVILTDLSANDGKIVWPNFSLRRRGHLLQQLRQLQPQIQNGELPTVNGVIPVIVTFHDPNPYTANHIEEYLEILLDNARELNLSVATKPFYDNRDEIEQAALARTIRDTQTIVKIPGFWTSLFDQIGGELAELFPPNAAH